MGGFGAFNLAFKHRDLFKVAVGVFPPLNLRWVDCHDNYRANFDPDCWGWRSELRPREVVARICIFRVRMWQLVDPILGGEPDAIEHMARENPIELLETLDIRPGQLDLYVAYAGKDQFNIDAQVESFLYVAKQRNLEIGVGYAPHGRHGPLTAVRLLPDIFDWLRERLTPYAPE
jgi:S-formylglutathione hydrolase FrmB